MSEFQVINVPREIAIQINKDPLITFAWVMEELAHRANMQVPDILPIPYESDRIKAGTNMVCLANPNIRVHSKPSVGGNDVQPHVLHMTAETDAEVRKKYLARLADDELYVHLGQPHSPQLVFKVTSVFNFRN